MLEIAGFTLSDYQETLGSTGPNFCATLMYQNKAVASISDGCSDKPNVEIFPNQEGINALKETLAEIQRVLPGSGVFPDTLENCVVTMCSIFDDLWLVPERCERARPNDRYAIVLLMGPLWTTSWVSKNIHGPLEIPTICSYFYPEENAALMPHIEELIKDETSTGEFSTCSAVWTIDLKDRDRFTLTLEQYIEIFCRAEAIAKELRLSAE